MPVTYSCDRCGSTIEKSLDAIKIIGGKNVNVLCEKCWQIIEGQVISQKEIQHTN